MLADWLLRPQDIFRTICFGEGKATNESKKYKPHFDERQQAIRSQVFGRTLVVTLALLGAFALIEAVTGRQFVEHWQAFILIGAASGTYCLIELLLRDAFYESTGVGWGRTFPIAFIAVIILVRATTNFVRGKPLVADGRLSVSGGFLLFGIMALAVGIIGFIKSRQLRFYGENAEIE